MKIEIFGDQTQGKSVMAIGTWSPLLPSDVRNVKNVIALAKEQNLRATLVLLYPKPGEILFDRKEPRYDCVHSCIDYLLQLGIDQVIKIKMTKMDLNGTAEAFLKMLKQKFQLRWLLLGKTQSLGFATKGNQETIARVCKSARIRLSYFRYTTKKTYEIKLFKKAIDSGSVKQLKSLLHRPSIWYNTRKKKYYIGWKPGQYKALFQLSHGEKIKANVRIRKSDYLNYFVWPSIKGVKNITFTDRKIA